MRSRLLAAALIVLTVLGTGSWHIEGDDPDFLPQASAHDHSTHHASFRSPASDSASHCAICHWLQLFRASHVRDARVYVRQVANATYGAGVVASPRAAALFDVPSRAPPA